MLCSVEETGAREVENIDLNRAAHNGQPGEKLFDT